MCLLEDYLIENSLSVESIHKYVDDYSIFSFYIGKELEINKIYSSPLRDSDEHPSFALYEARDGSIMFKDHGRNLKGGVLKFVRHLLSEDWDNLIPFQDVLHQINIDFDIGLAGTPKTFKPRAKIIKSYSKKPKTKIEIVSKRYNSSFLDYFTGKYDITSDILKMYNVYNVAMAKFNLFLVYQKTLCIAYKIGKYYKLCMPFNPKGERFRTDFPPNYVEGFLQLKYKLPFVIITKAMKEVMFFRKHFDWDSVAGKSENTMIPDFIMKKLFIRYKCVFIWLDRDQGGIEATKAYLDKYPGLISINYPTSIKEKDVTDRYFYMKTLNKEKESLKEIENVVIGYK